MFTETVFSPFNLGKSRRTVSLMYDSWEIKPPNFVETVMAITVANFASVSSSRYSGPCNIIVKSTVIPVTWQIRDDLLVLMHSA